MHKYLLLGHFPAAAWPSLTRTHVVLSTAQNVYFAKEVQICKDAKKYKQLTFLFYSSSTLVNGWKCLFSMGNVINDDKRHGRTWKDVKKIIFTFLISPLQCVTHPINGIVLLHLFLAQGSTITRSTSPLASVLRDTQRTPRSRRRCCRWSWARAWRLSSLALPFLILRCHHFKKEVSSLLKELSA